MVSNNFCNIKCDNNCKTGCDKCGSENGIYAFKYMTSESSTSIPFITVETRSGRPINKTISTARTTLISTNSVVSKTSKESTSSTTENYFLGKIF